MFSIVGIRVYLCIMYIMMYDFKFCFCGAIIPRDPEKVERWVFSTLPAKNVIKA